MQQTIPKCIRMDHPCYRAMHTYIGINSVASQTTLLFKRNYYTYSGIHNKQLNALVLLRQYDAIPLLYIHNAVFKPLQICLMTRIYVHIIVYP